MAAITFPRDQIFRGWVEGETSKVVGEKGLDDEEIEKGIAQYHTSESHEPYFYSWRLISQTNPARVNRESQKTQRLVLIIFASIVVSVIVYLVTRSYFDNVWKVCQSIAEKKEYGMDSVPWSSDHLWLFEKTKHWPYRFIRHATAADIWDQHPKGASGWFFLRNAFCLLFPFGGLFGGKALNEKDVNYEPEILCNLVIDRSKDDRVCPPNFDIQKDCDPLTQEPISIQKLHSPQMIYLPNYVADAKSFVSALLIAGKRDFLDPVDQREFTEGERKQILSQIERIFLISEERFNGCFELPWTSAFPIASESVEDQTPVVQLRDRVRSFIKKESGTRRAFFSYTTVCEKNKAYLSENDIAYLRVLQFENTTGVSLKKPQLQNEARIVPPDIFDTPVQKPHLCCSRLETSRWPKSKFQADCSILLPDYKGPGVDTVIPMDVLIYMAAFLHTEDVVSLSQCSRTLRTICATDSLWKPMSERLLLPPTDSSMTYRDQVINFYKKFEKFITSTFFQQFVFSINSSPQSKLKIPTFLQVSIDSLRTCSLADYQKIVSQTLEMNCLSIAFHFCQIGMIPVTIFYEALEIYKTRRLAKLSAQIIPGINNSINTPLKNRNEFLDFCPLEYRYLHLVSLIPADEYRGLIVCAALKINRLDIVKVQLEKGPISKKKRGDAVSTAVFTGELDIVDLLLKNGKISLFCRGNAVRNVALAGRLDILDLLLKNGEISLFHRGDAVKGAVLTGRLDILDLLLKNDEISLSHRGDAVWWSAKAGRLDIVDLLLKNGEISEEDMLKAFEIANEKGHRDIINLLLRHTPLSEQDLQEAVIKVKETQQLQSAL